MALSEDPALFPLNDIKWTRTPPLTSGYYPVYDGGVVAVVHTSQAVGSDCLWWSVPVKLPVPPKEK